MNEQTRVFLSYSHSKAYSPDAATRVIGAVRSEIESRATRGWEVVDAMEQGIGGIREKVYEELARSNALVAECTTSSPNVMFEIGYARAMRYPIVILVNSEAFNDESLQQYFEFLGHSEGKPLPADLGDVEFLSYNSEVTNTGGMAAFRRSLKKSLDLVGHALPPGILMLQEGRKRLEEQIRRLKDQHISRLPDRHTVRAKGKTPTPIDPPLLRLLGGWIQQVVGELSSAGQGGFLVHSNYYQSCFKKFRENERHHAVAIADLAVSVEDPWIRRPIGTQMSVGERIFLISGEEFFRTSVDRLFQGIRTHINQADNASYKVRITCADHPKLPDRHVFPKSTGRDLLAINPDLVGGYDNIDGTAFLRIVQSQDLYEKAREYYRAVQERSFEFDSNWTHVSQLRAAWFAQDGIGAWGRNWHYDFRDHQYYDFYDWHIRSWVPEYDRLIEHTGQKVAEALWNGFGDNRNRGSVLEIGCGTGALSRSIIKAVYLDERSRDAELCRMLIGIDKSEEMIDRADRMIRAQPVFGAVKLERATAFNGLPFSVTKEAPFAVICGSLVLSHLLQDNVEENFQGMLNHCDRLLAADGILVFADALVASAEHRENREQWWAAWMKDNGLDPETVELFIARNQEMLQTITREQLDRICASSGYLRPVIHTVPGSTDRSPFRIITIRKDMQAAAKSDPANVH